MTPTLLLPAALGALIAIAVPLAIHIARRTETQTIDFSALRWLNPNPRPVRRLRLDERLLLAVRIALILAIALLLAQPVARPPGDGRAVVAVSPAVNIADVPDGDERRVWLAPGFPGLDRPAPALPTNLASLIRQLDAETPARTPIAVVVPPELTGVDAQRLYLSRPVDWRVTASSRQPAPVAARAPPALIVRYSRDGEDAVRYFRAAATAFAEPGKPPAFDAGPVDRPLPRSARYLVWLSSAPMPSALLDWIEAGGVALLAHDAPSPVEGAQRVTWRDATGDPLASVGRFGKGRVLRLTRPLEPRAMPALVEADFPATLWSLLAPPPAPARVASADYGPTVRATPGAPSYNPHPVDLRPWLAVAIAALFAVERWLATRRRRPVAA
ncbi:BatA domain-containing protein [Caulobacter sp. ErkDOM-YI]|uniref:BatA domain-containing protein n=1 Tax=unclassified Caulobacter TaxID=2648921 RepID=UPI003AF5F14E